MNTASALNEIEVAVLQLMDEANSRESAPNEDIVQLRSKGSQNEAIPQTETENMSAIYRRAGVSGEEHTRLCREWYYGVNMPQKFMAICKKGGSRRAFAYRVLSNISKEVLRDQNGLERSYDITYFKETCYINYRVLWENIESFGRGLVELGISPNSRVAIYEETRWEWLATIYGIWSQNMVATTVYANLGEDALAYALRETGCKGIICNAKNVSVVIKFMSEGITPSVPIIYNGSLPASVDQEACHLVSWEEVVKLGREARDRLPLNNSGRADDLALIMYTSGTTGDPKGVIHTHGSLMSGVHALDHRLNAVMGPLRDGETYLSYLPLAHILELGVLSVFIARGALICFGSPFTLTDLTARPRGDLAEYNPSLLIGVPRIYDTLKKAIQAKLPAPGTFKRRAFDHAFQSRLRAFKDGKDSPYWDAKVFAATRAVLGKNMYMVLSGGGPLSTATQDFLNVAVVRIIQGWGLTETVCVGGVQLTGDIETGAVGPPLLSEEVKLLDVEGYKHTDEPDPRGEILLRGPFLFKGYYKQEELTKEAIDEDGWFHTGDVGSIGPNGTLRIIGRVKALAKNVLGEYVAMETLESMYAHNSLSMPNGVCVLVHPDRPYICALVLTDEAKVVAFTREHGLKGKYPEVLQDPEFQKKATASFQETARASDRQKFEIVRHVRLLSDEWTPENGVLTAVGKLKRRVIDERYTDIIAPLFVEEC